MADTPGTSLEVRIAIGNAIALLRALDANEFIASTGMAGRSGAGNPITPVSLDDLLEQAISSIEGERSFFVTEWKAAEEVTAPSKLGRLDELEAMLTKVSQAAKTLDTESGSYLHDRNLDSL